MCLFLLFAFSASLFCFIVFLSETDNVVSRWLHFLGLRSGYGREYGDVIVSHRLPLKPWAYICLRCVTAAVFTYLPSHIYFR